MTQSVSTRCLGYLKSINGREVTTRELSRSVGCKNTSVAAALQASVDAGIVGKRTTHEPAGLVTYWQHRSELHADWALYPAWMAGASSVWLPLRADARAAR